MFADQERRARKSESAIDALKARFGADAIMSGRSLKSGR
jgi:DNA polymerase-4